MGGISVYLQIYMLPWIFARGIHVLRIALHVQSRLHEENERCLLYLDGSTRKSLVVTAEKQLLSRHTAAILEKVK